MGEKFKERRKNPRIEFRKGVNYKILPKSRFNLGLSENISLGGIKLITFKAISPQEKILIEMQLDNEIIHIVSEVIWDKEFPYSVRYEVGFKFDYSQTSSFKPGINLSSNVKNIISDYLEDKISN